MGEKIRHFEIKSLNSVGYSIFGMKTAYFRWNKIKMHITRILSRRKLIQFVVQVKGGYFHIWKKIRRKCLYLVSNLYRDFPSILPVVPSQ